MADPLEFLDTNSMSPEERQALSLVTGAANPTLTPREDVPVAQGGLQGETAMVQPIVEAPASLAEGGDVAGGAHSVPLATFLDMRDKAKKAEDRAAALEAAQQTQEPIEFNIPDPKVDPAGFAQASQALTNLQILSERMNFSEDFARLKFKDEEGMVDAARDWAVGRFKTDPGYEDRIMNERDPYAAIIKDYKGSKQLETLETDDWTQFQAWKASQAGGNVSTSALVNTAPAAAAPAVAASQQQARALPPRSIADLPSAGGNLHTVAVGSGQAFDSVFPMR